MIEKAGVDRVVEDGVAGTWTNEDGFIRHTLHANGRYEESRGSKSGAFSGTYTVQGSRIDYLDDCGFFGYGELIDGALHHGGMVLRLRESFRSLPRLGG